MKPGVDCRHDDTHEPKRLRHPRERDTLAVLEAEVKRLRALIAAIRGVGLDGIWCNTPSERKALTEEASAIRKRDEP